MLTPVMLIVVSIATFANFAIIKYKLEQERWMDVFTDIFVLITLSYLFMGTMTGIVITMVSSMLMSLYLLQFPPKFKFLT